MNKKLGVINFIVTFVMTIASLFLIVYLCNEKSSASKPVLIILCYLGGAVFFGFLVTFLHELGHVAVGKSNGFYILSFSVLFFKWVKEKGKNVFYFTIPGEEAGSVELVSKTTENLEKRYKKMSAGGLWFTLIPLVLSPLPFIFMDKLPLLLFCALAMVLPVSLYSFVGNLIPMSTDGLANDGVVIYQIRKKTDSMKVTINLLAIQSELFNGKTPAEIDEKLYFDLPQLIEDDLNFTLLLNARYNYYLDKGDFDNAKKVSDRLQTLLEYMPKSYSLVVKADALFNACTFDFNEEIADDLMYELEGYLNKVNTATNVRVKLAYILGIQRDKEKLELFYKKGIKEASKCQIKGLGLFEKKLLKELKQNNE